MGARQTCTRSEEGLVERVLLVVVDVVLGDNGGRHDELDLRIVPCRLGDRAGVTGAAITAIEHVLSPAAVDRTLQAAAA